MHTGLYHWNEHVISRVWYGKALEKSKINIEQFKGFEQRRNRIVSAINIAVLATTKRIWIW